MRSAHSAKLKVEKGVPSHDSLMIVAMLRMRFFLGGRASSFSVKARSPRISIPRGEALVMIVMRLKAAKPFQQNPSRSSIVSCN